MTEPSTAAQNTLRGDILVGGHDDWVSMAEVRGCISRGRLADLAPKQQQLILQTIRSLLLDGLVEFGDIPPPATPASWCGRAPSSRSLRALPSGSSAATAIPTRGNTSTWGWLHT
jgi:hypothetical protein